MDVNRTINYLLILGGGITVLLADSDKPYSEYLLIAGALALMVGVYRVSRNIRSRGEGDQKKDEYIINDDFDDSKELDRENDKQ